MALCWQETQTVCAPRAAAHPYKKNLEAFASILAGKIPLPWGPGAVPTGVGFPGLALSWCDVLSQKGAPPSSPGIKHPLVQPGRMIRV